MIPNTNEMTPIWLTQILRTHGHLPQGEVVAVQPTASPASATVGPGFRPHNRLEIRYSPDAPAHAPRALYVKIGRPEDISSREYDFYTAVNPHMPYSAAPPCLASQQDPTTGQYCLLLTDLSATHRALHPENPASQTNTARLLTALARFHAFWWGHDLLGNGVGIRPSATTITEEFAELQRLFGDFVDFLGDGLSLPRRHIFEQILTHYPGVLTKRLAQKDHLTIVHSDAHVGNFLLPEKPTNPTYIIDWEQWDIHIGLGDVAYMMALFWYPERRQRLEEGLVRHYHDQLEQHGVTGYSWDDCWTDYRLQAINNLLVSFRAWQYGYWMYHRWHQLEKGMLAFADLDCQSLLR